MTFFCLFTGGTCPGVMRFLQGVLTGGCARANQFRIRVRCHCLVGEHGASSNQAGEGNCIVDYLVQVDTGRQSRPTGPHKAI